MDCTSARTLGRPGLFPHRAPGQARRINATGAGTDRQVGVTELTLQRLGPHLWRLELYRSGKRGRRLVSTLEGSLGHVLVVAQRACVTWACGDEARALRSG
jgi:hypothetical protein